jgi:hypothetical protein
MPKQVVAGAQLQCSFGIGPSILAVLPVNRVECTQEISANIQDHVPMVNIQPFGMCTCPGNPQVAAATSAAMGVLTPQPCIPNTPTPWTPGALTVLIANQPALDDVSTLTCVWGGIITIAWPGQDTTMIP